MKNRPRKVTWSNNLEMMRFKENAKSKAWISNKHQTSITKMSNKSFLQADVNQVSPFLWPIQKGNRIKKYISK